VEVRDPRSFSRNRHAGIGHGRQTISAPMPGKVVRVLVREGDIVQAGAGLIVVEAMKMQNEHKAPKAGTVIRLSVQEGGTVAAGEPLVVIE
jgi:biotin carboxyl carrier protein